MTRRGPQRERHATKSPLLTRPVRIETGIIASQDGQPSIDFRTNAGSPCTQTVLDSDTRGITRRMLEPSQVPPSFGPGLTRREREVLTILATGASHPRITRDATLART